MNVIDLKDYDRNGDDKNSGDNDRFEQDEVKYERLEYGMNSNCDHKGIEFDSTFECGNLDLVVKLDSDQDIYDLYMRPDTNSCGHS